MKKLALLLFVLITLGSVSLFAWNGVKIGKVSNETECENACFSRYRGHADWTQQWRLEKSTEEGKYWCYCRGTNAFD